MGDPFIAQGRNRTGSQERGATDGPRARAMRRRTTVLGPTPRSTFYSLRQPRPLALSHAQLPFPPLSYPLCLPRSRTRATFAGSSSLSSLCISSVSLIPRRFPKTIRRGLSDIKVSTSVLHSLWFIRDSAFFYTSPVPNFSSILD